MRNNREKIYRAIEAGGAINMITNEKNRVVYSNTSEQSGDVCNHVICYKPESGSKLRLDESGSEIILFLYFVPICSFLLNPRTELTLYEREELNARDTNGKK